MDEFEQQVLEQPVEEQNVVELEPDLQLEGDAVDAWNYTCWAKCRDEAWGPFTSWIWKPTNANRLFGSIEVACPFHEERDVRL